MDRNWTLGALAVALVACGDKGSIGNYEEGSGGVEEGGSSTGTETGASQTGASQTSASETSASTTAVSDTDATTADTIGEPVCPDGNGCPLTADCEELACGEVHSRFDDDACVRAFCGSDDQCQKGDRCFVGMEFGLCEGSAVDCTDVLDGPNPGCNCGGTPDCNGGHCVPAEIFPPTIVDEDFYYTQLVSSCGPDDGIMLTLQVYSDGAFNACEPSGDAIEELHLEFTDAQPQVGEYELGIATSGGQGTNREDDGTLVPVWRAVLVITAIDETTVTGSVEVAVPVEGMLTVLEWEFDGMPYCPEPLMCG